MNIEATVTISINTMNREAVIVKETIAITETIIIEMTIKTIQEEDLLQE